MAQCFDKESVDDKNCLGLVAGNLKHCDSRDSGGRCSVIGSVEDWYNHHEILE